MVEGGAAHWIADRASGSIVAQPRWRRKLTSADFRVEVSCFLFKKKLLMSRETGRIFFTCMDAEFRGATDLKLARNWVTLPLLKSIL
jgi:hypothetical protein